MINDKKLYDLMIKYHSTFIGWFVHKGLVGKNDARLFLIKGNQEEKENCSVPTENQYEVYKILPDGVKRILGRSQDKNFCKIDLNNKVNGYSYKPIVDAGFPIFDFSSGSGRYCFVHQVEDIINNFNDLVLDIHLPNNFKRLKGKSRDNYLKYLDNQIRYVKSYDKNFINNYRFYFYIIGEQQTPQKLASLENNGIFAIADIYKFVEWDFDLVEQYKDQIIWIRLINDSNLIWPEEMLLKYDAYIPYCTTKTETYRDKFANDLDYTKFGPLSNKFIDSHKDVLDWMKFFKECKFQWNDSELSYFCNYALSINMPYDSYRNTMAASQIAYSIESLLSNQSFIWTADNLLAFLLVRDQNWKSLVNEFRPQIFRVFRSIPDIREIAEPNVKGIDNFWEIVNNTHPYPYDKLTREFTIENIKNNIEEWSKVLEDKYLSMRRTPDTNYYYYWAKTQWDVYVNNINIPLTYDLAKYLSSIHIKLGGTYMESDGGTIEEDHRFPVFNGLAAFSSHHIDSEKDMEEMLIDYKITNIVLGLSNSTNIDLLYYAIKLFFKDYALADYIEMVNRLKDWYVVKEFHSGSDKLHGESNNYLKSLIKHDGNI